MQEKLRASRGQQIARTRTNTYLTTFLLGAVVSPRGRGGIALSDSSSPAALRIAMANQGVACMHKEIRSAALPVLQGITWLRTAI